MRQFLSLISPDWQPPAPSPTRLTRSTPGPLVRLQLKWEAAHHHDPDLKLPEDRQVEWRMLSGRQAARLDCADARCALVRDLLGRAHAAGRAAQLAEVARSLNAMVGPK